MRFIAALLLIALATVEANAEESLIGKPVFWKPWSKATVQLREVDIETVPFPSIVMEEKGDLIQLEQAWVHKSDVMSRQEAIEFFSKKIRDDATNSYWWSKRGLVWPISILKKNGNRGDHADGFQNAMYDHAEAIRLDPNNASYFYNRGKTAWTFNLWDQAIKDVTEAIRLDPKHVNSYRIRAAAWSLKQKPDKAISDLTEVLRIEQNDASAYYDRGQAWAMKSDMVRKSSVKKECRQKAINDYAEVIRLDSKFVSAYVARAYIWNIYPDSFDQPIADMSACIKLQPKQYQYYEYRGYLQASKGNADEAIHDYTMALNLRPKNSEAYHRRGEEWSKKREFDESIKDFTEAIRIDLNSGDALKAGFGRYGTAYNSRGIAWRTKGEYEKALQDFEQAIRIAPEDLRPLANIAWLRATCPDDRLRNGKEAVDFATKSMSSCRECSGLDTLAAAYAEVGDFTNAVKWAEKAVEVAPESNKKEITKRLSLYRSNKPYRETPQELKK